jgi:hypothetical protein
MSYIVQRQDRFYVVAYDGIDPLTGRERRRWHPIGHDRDEAEQLAARLDHDRDATPTAPAGPVTFGEYLTNTWIPHKRRQVRGHHRLSIRVVRRPLHPTRPRRQTEGSPSASRYWRSPRVVSRRERTRTTITSCR